MIVELANMLRKEQINMEKNKEFDFEKCQAACKMLLEALGEDVNRPGLIESPKRMAKAWKELTEGSHYTNEEIADMFRKEFEVGYDPIVTIYQENIFSTCEHHAMLMYDGSAIVGYIPIQNEDGTYKVLGLSKLYRIIDMCAKRLQLQEKLASDIAECISLATGSQEVYVNLNMKHGCVSARGAKAQGCTNVTFMTKALRKNVETRNEFERKASEIITRLGR